MAVSNINQIGRSYAEELASQQTRNKELDKEAFLKILVAQLQYQDPTQPVSDTEFISQLAQFSALEQMSALNQNFVDTQAYGLLGRYVLAQVNINGDKRDVFGMVDSVVKMDGKTYLNVGTDKIAVSDVNGVFDKTMFGTNEELLSNASLIGRQVSAYIMDENNETISVSGVLERIFIKEGVLFAQVDGSEVSLYDIFDIGV